MVKGFRIKGLASVMLAGVFCFCAAVPALAAGTVRSLNLRFEDQYELGTIVEPEITCVSAGITIDSVTWEKDTDLWKPGKKVTAVIEVSSDGGREFLSSYGAESCKISGARLTSAKGDGDTAIIKATIRWSSWIPRRRPDGARKIHKRRSGKKRTTPQPMGSAFTGTDTW